MNELLKAIVAVNNVLADLINHKAASEPSNDEALFLQGLLDTLTESKTELRNAVKDWPDQTVFTYCDDE